LFLIGGSLQVLMTIGYVTLVADLYGFSIVKSIFIGFVISLSSTAIVIKLLQDRGEIDSPHGQTSLGILLFQDFVIVPMMLLTPVLAGSSGTVSQSLLLVILEGIGIILLVVVSAKWIVPYLLFQVAKTRSKELFILSVVVICLAIAYLTSSIGLSLALGAFLAGLIISESEYSHEALEKIDPFKDLFISLFFISIGMLLDLGFLMNNLLFVLAITICILAIKSMLAGFSAVIMGLPMRTAILAGFALAQVGEFSFILAHTGFQYDLINHTEYQMLLAGSVITMALTPFMMTVAPRAATFASRLPISERLISGRKFSHIDQLDKTDLVQTDVYSVLSDAIKAVKHTFPNKELAPNISIKPDQYSIMVDEFFVDVLYNLLHNLMKFDEHDEVKVDISAGMDEKEEYLEIRIADYGPGISDDQKDKLFTRLGPTKASGSGIGLTLVKRIIERYDGKICVENRIPNEMSSGACFVICLHHTH